jgi:hypothetical protein
MNVQRRTTDNCDIVSSVPEMLFGAPSLADANGTAWLPGSFCHQQSPWLAQVKFLGTYTVPRVDVQVSGTVQSRPGAQILANFTATNAVVARSLGRNLSGNASNLVANVLAPGAIYGERMNQLDVRLAKILKFGRARATAQVDLYNVFNANAVLTQSNAFATWQRPQSILNARFAKVGVQFAF